MSFVVGLTGGIGSGKTTVSQFFAELGVAIVDTDVIARELTSKRGIAMPAIIGAFGCSVLQRDGSLDRAVMRQLCFSDPTERRRLEAILHPLIRTESVVRCHQSDYASYTMLVVPLLIESGAYREHVDRILVVDCDQAQQIDRVMARSSLGEEEIQKILATQAGRAERLSAADDVLSNVGGRDELQMAVLSLHQHYLDLARRASV